VAAHRSTDARIAAIAARQHGIVTTVQLRACGLSDSAISKRVTAGRLHRVHRGVHAVGHGGMSREARWIAAVFAAGPGALLSHFGAAVHWRIWRGAMPGAIDVVGPRSRIHATGVRVHECRSLTSRDRVRRDGIPVTSVARTALDLGDELSPWRLANVLHEAQWRRILRPREVEDVLRRGRGRAAVTVLRRALELNAIGSAGTKSDFEDEVLALLLDLGAPAPLVNVRLDDGAGGTIEVDFHWPRACVILEADGDHSRARTKREDADRDRRLRAAGWTVIRCTPRTYRRVVAELVRTHL
jgi:hypothetical protein